MSTESGFYCIDLNQPVSTVTHVILPRANLILHLPISLSVPEDYSEEQKFTNKREFLLNGSAELGRGRESYRKVFYDFLAEVC